MSGRIYSLDEPYRPGPKKNNLWYSDRATEQVIVFVHGVLSDSHGCWYREPAENALGVYWPDLLQKDDRFAEYSIYLGGYYTDIDSGPYEVSDCAEELFQALERPDAKTKKVVLDHRTILFVCHSMGGIVVRYMLTARPGRFATKKIGLALIASPSSGSPWANRLDLLVKYFKHAQGKSLEWGSWSLRDLDHRFTLLLEDKAVPQLFGVEACENRFILHSKLLRSFEPVVPRESAGRYFGRVRMLPNTDHFSCVKPNDSEHPAYEFLADFIRDFKRSASLALPRTVRSAAQFESHTSVPGQPHCQSFHWDITIDEEGDAYNEMTYVGVVLPRDANIYELPPAEVQSGHESPFELVRDGRTSEGVTLEEVHTSAQKVQINVRFANPPTELRPASFCLRCHDWNAFAMNMEEYRQKPGWREDGLDYVEKSIPEGWDVFSLAIKFPEQLVFAKPPFLEVFDYSDGPEKRNNELTEKYQRCFYFSNALRHAALIIQCPDPSFSYRISWLLGESPVEVTSALVPLARSKQRAFARKLLLMSKDAAPEGTAATRDTVYSALASVAEYVQERLGGSELLDSTQFELSLMVLDEERPEVPPIGGRGLPVLRVVAGTHLQDPAYRNLFLFVGDGNAGRAWKRRMARVFDDTEKDPKRHIYIPLIAPLRHRFLISIPLIDPESAALLYGVLNIGAFSESQAELLRPLGSPEGIQALTSYAHSYVLKRLLEGVKM